MPLYIVQLSVTLTAHLSRGSEICATAAAALAEFVQTSRAHEADKLSAGLQLSFLHFCVSHFFCVQMFEADFFLTFLCLPLI